MHQFPALGQVYLDSPSNIDSYLPQFVLQSDVFNKEVKNILLRISDIETSTTNTLPNEHQQQPPAFTSTHEEINFLRKLVNQKNQQLENYGKQIDELRQIRISDCNLIEELESRIRGLEEQREHEIGRHSTQKQHLLERMNKIEEQIDNIDHKGGEERRVYELEMEIEILRGRLMEQGKQMISENIVDSFKIQQMTQEILDLRALNNNLVTQNGQYKFQLDLSLPLGDQLEGLKSKVIEQQREISSYKYSNGQSQQLQQKLMMKENEIVYLTGTIESLNKEVKNLRESMSEMNIKSMDHQSLMTIQSHAEREAEYLNREIQELRRQLQEITKKENETYEERVKYQRECYKLTNELHEVTLLRGEVETKQFQLEMSRNQLLRIQRQLDIQVVSNRQLSNSKEYFQGAFNKNQQQKHEIGMKLQSAQLESARCRTLEAQMGEMGQELSEIHKKYIESNNRSSEIVLKYQVVVKENESLKGLMNSNRLQSESIREGLENKLYYKEEELARVRGENKELRSLNQRAESQCSSLENQLNYNDSKLSSFQQTLLEFQKSYRQLQLQLQQIRSSITELQQLQNIFLHKQSQLLDLVSINVNRLIKYREGIRVEHNYKLEKRANLLNQLIEITQSQNIEINESKHFIHTLEERIQACSSEVDKNKLQMNTLVFQKQHLFNQLDSVLEKLKYVESHLERQTRTNEIQQQEIQQLRRMNKNSNDRLGEEMHKKVWLENRLGGGGGDIEGMKMERDQTIKRMRGILQGE